MYIFALLFTIVINSLFSSNKIFYARKSNLMITNQFTNTSVSWVVVYSYSSV